MNRLPQSSMKGPNGREPQFMKIVRSKCRILSLRPVERSMFQMWLLFSLMVILWAFVAGFLSSILGPPSTLQMNCGRLTEPSMPTIALWMNALPFSGHAILRMTRFGAAWIDSHRSRITLFVSILFPPMRSAFDEHFDHHVLEQKQQDLVDQEKAKYHGKAKTKHLRLALALHLFEQTRLQRTSENWDLVLASKHLVVASKLGDYLDMVTDRLAQLFVQVTSDAKPAVASPSDQVKLSARQQLLNVLQGEFAFFRDLPLEKQVFFWKLAQLFLQSTAVWIENAAFGRQQAVKNLLQSVGDVGNHVIPRAANLLQHLSLAVIVMGKNTHGTPLFYVVKRHLDASEPGFTSLSNLLVEFEIPLHAYKTFPTAVVLQHRPAHASSLPSFAAVDEDAVRPHVAIVQGWRSVTHERAAAGAALVPSIRSLN